MTTPPPQQPPGPYGPPQHQQPYPQQYPQPQQYPYPYPGQPPYPPPRKNRTGMVIGIIAASLAGLGLIAFGVGRLGEARSQAGGSGFPEAEYRLTAPKALLDGEYELVQDLSQTEGKKALDGAYDPKIRNPEPVVAQYTSESRKGVGALVISGMYGQFKDPATARRKMLSGAADAKGATLAVPAREITPAGSGITVSCQVLTSAQDGTRTTVPMCAWADENTGASVGVITPESAQQDPKSVDLAKVAESTLKVREEARQPIR
ncbi:hypothetical protein OHB39_24325 [Streptomyces sp. NBC_00047]|uniref:hypothetical protein n=1 Tax=Streptomyces sp. NBC_00047 TaxID=2975627 RepID=UPI00224E3EA5|nr:hypothetical protein [Streptomyces sp. NBC_00047]MCX5610669.1 hypothetical protein [Streptomyces sp. NBC_00047]